MRLLVSRRLALMRRYQSGISFGPEPTAADLAAAFGLSRTGPGNYNGPCPLCSGDDRFHVHEVDGRAVVGCRGCIDGLAKPERSARYGEVMRLYRGDGQRTTRHAPAQAVGPGRPHGAADRIALARKKWASAAPIPTDPEHPARRWLAARHLWRPDLQLPPSVRWLEASGGPSVGGLLAAFAPPGHGQPSGVQLVSVDGDGRPAPDRAGPTGLAKRSIGAMRGAVCVLGLPDAVSGVNVAEGLADVLALASRLPWPAICTGGSGGFKNHDLARWLAGLGAVHVWADLDEPDGIKAAGVLAGRVVVLGGVSWIERVGVGADPGEAGAPFPPLDAAAVESYAGDLERDGLPTWEARRLASVICAKLE